MSGYAVRPTGPLVVRPIARDEVARFNAELDAHHWLGHRLVGETLRHVATEDGHWVALLGFGSAAFKCAARDHFIGWSSECQFRRLRFVANNQRFCVLPAYRRPNLASAVLSRALARLSRDYLSAYGHPVLAVETFTDPTRHTGACYAAASFHRLGETLGYRRSGGRYIHHGQPKVVWYRALRRDAAAILAAPFDHPALACPVTERMPMPDLNRLDLTGQDGLLTRLGALPDPRMRRGIRHKIPPILAVAAVAVISGAKSFAAIGEFAGELGQEALARLGARRRPSDGRFLAPSEATIRRTIRDIDTDALDAQLGAWLEEQVRAGRIEADHLAIAVDGKSVRGAVGEDGRAVHLLAAMVHREGAVIAQREVDHKTNEITVFRPLLEGLDLAGAVVTADAMHTQREHAKFLVEDKGADFVFTAKGNQPDLAEAIQTLGEGSFSPCSH